AAGTVTALGTGVSEPRVGTRVAYCGILGAYAPYAAVAADRLVVLPDGVTARQGAAALLQGMTAHHLATTTYPLNAGTTCVVHAAAGGVGLLLCQIARRQGARVIGTVSTREKAVLAREAGAHDVILYTEQDFEVEVKRLTDNRGVEVIYDLAAECGHDVRGARRGGRRRPAAVSDRATAGRAGHRHGLHAREGGPRAGGGRPRRDPLHRAGLRGGGEAAHGQPRRGGDLRL